MPSPGLTASEWYRIQSEAIAQRRREQQERVNTAVRQDAQLSVDAAVEDQGRNGEINRTTEPFWRNQAPPATADSLAQAFNAENPILRYMERRDRAAREANAAAVPSGRISDEARAARDWDESAAFTMPVHHVINPETADEEVRTEPMKPEPLGAPIKLDPAVLEAQHQKKKIPRRVYLVGVELEGGWRSVPQGRSGVDRDGSVRFSDQEIVTHNLRAIGEIPSPPLPVEDYQAWVRKYYPHRVNDTCGLHVHLSFKTSLTYARLMTNAYPSTVLAYLTAWAKEEKLPKDHPIWPRLRGQSEYCQHVFSADLQVQNKRKDFDHHRHGNRYSLINYAYYVNNTLECRLLPMLETADQAIRAIERYIAITNAFLVATAKREPKHETKVIVDEECSESERVVRA